jgi:formate hydrogenlyase subunit 3/multisubunit Na+/H+ antiporter MnhD subunit
MIHPLFFALLACLVLVAAALSVLLLRAPQLQRGMLTMALTLAGGLSITAGFAGLINPDITIITLPLGLPWLPLHVGLDALASFFLLVIGGLLLPVGIYGHGYLSHEPRIAPLLVFIPLFALGMIGVVLAQDALAFMLFWELMSVSSYFLVTFEHTQLENRKAGFLYLLMAHMAGLLILGSFAVLYAAGNSFLFSAMRDAALDPLWAAIAFLLAAFGFGTKAGVVPLHGWLPDAHPVAPSNVSALMSGIMLKVAIFGFIRVVWDLVGMSDFQWWWGALILVAGSSSAVGGILLALQQHDLKRLLAYSSVENIGIILIGLGLAMLLAHFNHPLLAALGLIAALYHTINHALFKGLLFMGAGAVLHSTGTRNMEEMGGLIHRMPATSVFFLVACISISALPPFNGFVSEWLTFQTALMAPHLGETLLTAMVPFSAAMLALAGALAATCFVKVFGVVFLGQPRSALAGQAQEVDGWMKLGMAIPAVCCLLLGLLPVWFIPLLDGIPQALLHTSLIGSIHQHGWLWLSPVSAEHASYSPLFALLGMLALGGIAYMYLHGKGRVIRRSAPWSCGHPHTTPRMQYTATSFSQPLRRIFGGILQPDEHSHTERPEHTLQTKHVQYTVHVADLAVKHIYQPIGNSVKNLARWLNQQHQHGMHAYLSWTFITIILLLAVFA